jgi:hypothetical protein
MNYAQFLMTHLLRDIYEEYNILSYDILWDLSFDFYSNRFLHSQWNNKNHDLYYCIQSFIEDNKYFLLEEIKSYI